MTDKRSDFPTWAAAARPRLRRTAYLLCADWHLAEDLTQDTLVRVYAKWHRITSDDPDGYARVTLVNTYRSVLRRPWRRESTTSVMPDEATGATAGRLSGADAFDERDALLTGLAGLGRSQREVIVLRYWEDMSVADVADLLKISTGTVKSQSARGLSRLRAALAATELTTTEGER